ncbi:MAG UNVERIFIED_CONTAM: hypothetical protein LVT10_14415 [Anaerolineae bacterium]|jgi:hypothetical protein
MFTNLNGVATGLVGSLGYWLEQQGVRRGNQPQYYYLTIIIPLYEYLPMIGSFFAMIAGLFGFWKFRAQQLEASVTTVTDEDTSLPTQPALRPDQRFRSIAVLALCGVVGSAQPDRLYLSWGKDALVDHSTLPCL